MENIMAKKRKPGEFTKEEIASFHAKYKKPLFGIPDFNAVLAKEVSDLTYKDIRILISKVGWLDDSERIKYKKVLTEDNLTEEERASYTIIYANPLQFHKYFPIKGEQ